MAISVGELRAVLSLDDRFSRPASDVSKTLDSMRASFGALSQFAALSVGAIGAAGAAIVQLGQRGAAADRDQLVTCGPLRGWGSGSTVPLHLVVTCL